MPSVGFNSKSYTFSRIWVRNGKGPKVPHPFSYDMAAVRKTNYPASFTVGSGGVCTHRGTVPPRLRYILATKMRDKAYTSMQLGADIGEMHQTLGLLSGLIKAVRSPLKTVGEYMRKAALRKKRPVAELLLKDSADALLQFQYGVRPLLGSIFDAADLIKKPFPRHRVSYKCGDTYETVYLGNSGVNLYREDSTYRVDLRGYFELQLENPALWSVEAFGLLNPLSIMWELTTLSFIVDWFLPIGRYIESLSDYAGCKFINAYETSFIHANGTRAYPNRKEKWYAIDEAITCRRTLGVTGLPPITTLPLKWGQSREHVLNAIALACNPVRKLLGLR